MVSLKSLAYSAVESFIKSNDVVMDICWIPQTE